MVDVLDIDSLGFEVRFGEGLRLLGSYQEISERFVSDGAGKNQHILKGGINDIRIGSH
ncbi:MAG: hypothetical protein ACFFFC_19180 [Candidatus Thorarchaeota archaeon]